MGPDEFELGENKMSLDPSPAGKLTGKAEDDDVKVVTPRGNKKFFTSAIYYKK
jgi:transcription elongation factor GreB